jgi:hypothetical protein
MLQSQVLDMAHARSTDMFGEVQGSARRWSVQDDQGERQVCAVFAIGLHITEGITMKPLYSTYDYDAMNNGVQANGEPKPDTIIESIQEVDSRRGSVKVIWPLSSV